MFAVLKKESGKVVKILNIADEQEGNDTTSREMLRGFCNVINEKFEEFDEEAEILRLSSADERKNCLYYYDLDDFPEEMCLLKEVLKENSRFETFNFQEDMLEEITAFIVIVGNAERKIALYKQQHPISLLKRDKYMLTPVPHRNRLKKFEQDILRVDFNFQFFVWDGTVYISDLDRMEKICSFHNIIINEARKSIEAITGIDILDNVEVLEDELENVAFARKLTRVYKDTKVLGRVPNKRIIAFTKEHKYFKKHPLKVDGERFVLDTKKSKETFIKLMNDDFLVSQLTCDEYESLAKNNIS